MHTYLCHMRNFQSHMRTYHRWQTSTESCGPLLNKVKTSVLSYTTLSQICADDTTPLDRVIDCMPAVNFSNKPDLADVLVGLSGDFVTLLENDIVTYNLRNIVAIGSSTNVEDSPVSRLAAGYGFAFILLIVQGGLSISTDFLFLQRDTMKNIFLCPRFLALVETVTAYIMMGNQDIIKRRNVEGTRSLQSLLDEREPKWNRYV